MRPLPGYAAAAAAAAATAENDEDRFELLVVLLVLFPRLELDEELRFDDDGWCWGELFKELVEWEDNDDDEDEDEDDDDEDDESGLMDGGGVSWFV